ncbi:MAG: 30S ribosome-binding factor RbfA [Coriobacteriaceae bacterium]|nr:30S ribosome-binding factor RbfA [Coriobacteriaceae bacterium]
MAASPRMRKVNEAVREALAEVLAAEVADPRLELVTITAVEVARDLKTAKVYVIAHGADEEYARALEGLESASNRMRRGLSQRVRMRYTPELRFMIDTTVDDGMRIYEALKNVPPSMLHEDGAEETGQG